MLEKVAIPTAGHVVLQGMCQGCAQGRTWHHQHQNQQQQEKHPKKQWDRKVWPDTQWLQWMDWGCKEGKKYVTHLPQRDVPPRKGKKHQPKEAEGAAVTEGAGEAAATKTAEAAYQKDSNKSVRRSSSSCLLQNRSRWWSRQKLFYYWSWICL